MKRSCLLGSSVGVTGWLLTALAWLGVSACGDGVAEASEDPRVHGSGGAAAAGGAGAVCAVPLAQRVVVSTVDATIPILANDEYTPVVISPSPSGGSLMAWREQASPTIRVATLNAADELVGTPFSFAGVEVHDVTAHDDGGGVIAVIEEDPDIYSDKYCRGEATPDANPCSKLDLLRFDAAGAATWRTTLTDKINVDADGALFVWWYQHTARIAWSGQEWGVYFRSAGSTLRPGVAGEVDIHAGDTLRFVDAGGNRLDGGWRWGCSHSWAVRLAYNGLFGAACHGDGHPTALRLTVLDRNGTLGDVLLHDGMDPTRRALGGLVPTSGGFWLSHLAEGAGGAPLELHLVRVDNTATAGPDQVLGEAQGIDDVYVFRAYLAAYGNGQLLAGYQSGGQLQLAVLDGTTGTLLEGPVGVDASIDQFVEFVSAPNGDVMWAWSPGGSSQVSVVRVRACE